MLLLFFTAIDSRAVSWGKWRSWSWERTIHEQRRERAADQRENKQEAVHASVRRSSVAAQVVQEQHEGRHTSRWYGVSLYFIWEKGNFIGCNILVVFFICNLIQQKQGKAVTACNVNILLSVEHWVFDSSFYWLYLL